MANHCTIKTRKKLAYSQITADLHEINKRRFGGLLEIQEAIESNSWNIVYEDDSGVWAFYLWLKDPRTVEISHSGRHWMFWADVEFTNELAVKYNGTIRDEGVEGKWKGESNKYPTVRSWFESLYGPLQQLLDLDMGFVPEPIKRIGKS